MWKISVFEFCRVTEMVVANTCRKKPQNKLVICVSICILSAVDCLLLRQCDQCNYYPRRRTASSARILRSLCHDACGYVCGCVC